MQLVYMYTRFQRLLCEVVNFLLSRDTANLITTQLIYSRIQFVEINSTDQSALFYVSICKRFVEEFTDELFSLNRLDPAILDWWKALAVSLVVPHLE